MSCLALSLLSPLKQTLCPVRWIFIYCCSVSDPEFGSRPVGTSPNPIVSDGPPQMHFSAHALFRMEESDVGGDLVRRLLTSPLADFQIDEKSGHYVFRSRDYRIVVRKGPERSFHVMSVFRTDQKPD
jgi:hypothetical protein